ncbi:hypothetical protein [Colwellia sp. E2M01]|uniref:hypothetical protein n=1 Tax=Colwellia sp. E2M01 TaxID=2841561 RepID=UPI001C0A63EF|nr:hypothetical protein [Colwellia sp. E2M01]MBU2871972.1 hypothetical protein [Colwellia sp. E2M01]
MQLSSSTSDQTSSATDVGFTGGSLIKGNSGIDSNVIAVVAVVALLFLLKKG